MKKNIQNGILAGIIGTGIMSLFMFLGSLSGLPKLNPPSMLSEMSGIPLFAGWFMHFMIGIIFGLSYTLLLTKLLVKIPGKLLKGLAFGLIVFIFAQIAMGVMGALMGGIPAPQGNMAMVMIGSIIGHLLYGVSVSLIATND